MKDERPLTEVAVGLVFDHHGRVLLGQRPAGKPYAGWWEFPGGKLEAGESPAAALARELHEELGIAVRASRPWIVREHSYPHARVRLHFRRVFDWDGEPVAREGQAFGWTRPDAIDREPLLPATVPILAMLALPRRIVGLAMDRLADRPLPAIPRGPAAAATAAAESAAGRALRPRVLFVLDLAEAPIRPGAAGHTAAETGLLARALQRVRAVPGAVVCAGAGWLASMGGLDDTGEGTQALGCDGIVAPPDRLPARGAGLLGLRIDTLEDLALLGKVDADFAVVTADVGARLDAFAHALSITTMPVYLRVAQGCNAGLRPAGLQGTASGCWPRA